MKKKRKGLTKRQLSVIEDLIGGGMDEPELLKKHGLSRRLFRHWMSSEEFTAEVSFRMDSACRQSSFLLARYAPVAAAKLVELTESDKGETVRKACLDIMSSCGDLPQSLHAQSGGDADEPAEKGVLPAISTNKASEMLKILAKNED